MNDLGEEGEQRVREAYGQNYERLVALKQKYDPTNFFRLNQNIWPAGVSGQATSANVAPYPIFADFSRVIWSSR